MFKGRIAAAHDGQRVKVKVVKKFTLIHFGQPTHQPILHLINIIKPSRERCFLFYQFIYQYHVFFFSVLTLVICVGISSVGVYKYAPSIYKLYLVTRNLLPAKDFVQRDITKKYENMSYKILKIGLLVYQSICPFNPHYHVFYFNSS